MVSEQRLHEPKVGVGVVVAPLHGGRLAALVRAVRAQRVWAHHAARRLAPVLLRRRQVGEQRRPAGRRGRIRLAAVRLGGSAAAAAAASPAMAAWAAAAAASSGGSL